MGRQSFAGERYQPSVKGHRYTGQSDLLFRRSAPGTITFKGAFSDDGKEISGQFTQNTSSYPFKLSRTPAAALQGAAVVMDPNELLAMMASFSGPLSDRPFVPPLSHPSVGYGVRAASDSVANLLREVQGGGVELKFEQTSKRLSRLPSFAQQSGCSCEVFTLRWTVLRSIHSAHSCSITGPNSRNDGEAGM